MKHLRLLIPCLLLALLTAGCTKGYTEPPDLTSAASQAASEAPADEQRLLVGVWRNAGQYGEGRDFVETMTLDEGGICTIVLDYQGVENYQTLTGVYTVEDGMLLVTLEGDDGSYERNYRYTLDGVVLTLDNGEKSAVYRKLS